MKWNNRDKDNRRVKIEGVSFDYQLLKPAEDDETGEASGVASISDIANSRSREIKDQLVSIQREIKGLSKILMFGCFIIIAAIAYFGTH
jgi:hypothetical protein